VKITVIKTFITKKQLQANAVSTKTPIYFKGLG